MPAWLLPLVADAAIQAGSYLWSRHDAGNAHQREVEDMKKAGLNPMWVGAGQGTSVVSPPSVNVGSDIQAGLALERQPMTQVEQRARVQEILARAARETNESGLLADTRELKVLLLSGQVKLQDLSMDQKKEMFPLLLGQVRAETEASTSSARNAAANAYLNELAAGKALNDKEWEDLVGIAGPLGRVLRDLAKITGLGYLLAR